MNDTIFIPQKIKVGYNERKDTYTGKLAYVIYYDSKNKLRKEASWQTWRDKKIEPTDFKNEPTSGFVLNKKVGGYKYDWNPRQTYARVFDPRGFEFEISIPNLLYILENANCIKGKGLEGDFVYGWDGTELLLIPKEAPEYAKLFAHSELLANPESIKGKDLILGGTYKTNRNTEAIYLGRFDYFSDNYYEKGVNKGKKYFFKEIREDSYIQYLTPKSLGKVIVQLVSSEPVSNYAELMEELQGQNIYSPVDKRNDKYVELTADELTKDGRRDSVYIDYEGGKILVYLHAKENLITHHADYRYSYHYWYRGSARTYEETTDRARLFVRSVQARKEKENLSFSQLHEIYKFTKLVKHLANGRPAAKQD